MKVNRGKDKLGYAEGQCRASSTRNKLEGCRLKGDKNKRVDNLIPSM